MANEISINWSLRLLKGKLKINEGPNTVQATMAGDDITRNVQSIPTAAGAAQGTLIVISPAVAVRWGFFKNLDAVNFVLLGVRDGGGTFIPFAKIKAGESFPMPSATDLLYARADTAAVRLESGFSED